MAANNLKNFFKWGGLLQIAVLLAIAGGCSTTSRAEKKKISKTLTLAYQTKIRSLSPRIGTDFPASLFVSLMFEGLMRKNAQGEVECGVADHYTVSEDKCIYTFYLKKTKWSSGKYVTAHDFEYSWKASVDPATAKTGSMSFYIIKNAMECLKGNKPLNELGVKAIDDFTLEVKLENPAPYFLSLTTCSMYAPISKDNEELNPAWSFRDGRCLIGNGPFMVSHWDKGNFISLEKNSMYWDEANVKLQYVKGLLIEDENVIAHMFKTRQLDYIGSPFSAVSADHAMHKDLRPYVKNVETNRVEWLFVNVNRPPFNDKNFRKALAYAVNRKVLAEHIYQTGEKPAMGILGATLALNKEGYFSDANYEEAKKLFEKVKRDKPGFDTNSFSINFAPSEKAKRVVQALQDQWRKVLGCYVSLRQQEWPVHFQNCVRGDFDLAQMVWVSWLDDPIYALQTFRKKETATNIGHWYNAEYEALLDASDIEKDEKKRLEYLKKAEGILMDEMPIIPLVFSPAIYLHHDYVDGIVISPLMEVNLRYVDLDSEKKFKCL